MESNTYFLNLKLVEFDRVIGEDLSIQLVFRTVLVTSNTATYELVWTFSFDKLNKLKFDNVFASNVKKKIFV
jgi:hypothetical protein